MPIPPVSQTQAQSIQPYIVDVNKAGATGTTLLPLDKAEQIALANATTVLPRTGVGSPTWTADQVIAIHFDGNVERAIFMHDEPTFDFYQDTIPVTGQPNNSAATYTPVPFVKFVKFAGAVNLANGRRTTPAIF